MYPRFYNYPAVAPTTKAASLKGECHNKNHVSGFSFTDTSALGEYTDICSGEFCIVDLSVVIEQNLGSSFLF